MKHTDEFEDLIKNFKLDELPDTPAKPPARPAQNQTVSAEPMRNPNGYSREPRYEPQREEYYGRDLRNPRYRASEPEMSEPDYPQNNPPASPKRGKSDKFEVHIDEDEFYGSDNSAAGTGHGGGFRSGNDDPDYHDFDDHDPQDSHDDHDPYGEDLPSLTSGITRWTKVLISMAVVIGVSIFLAFFALQSASDLFGLNKPDQTIEVEVPDNLSMKQVSKLLTEKGVISQTLTFQIYANIKSEAADFYPGVYTFNSNMSYDELIGALSNGTIKQVITSVTFYEGMTLREIADRLEEKKVVDADKFIDYLHSAEIKYDFATQIPESDLRFHKFEGYLFPDTYDFYENSEPKDVAQKFFSNFNKQIDDELFAAMKERNLTLDEAITLASIIQKEAGNVEDMNMVSSIFHNRLRNPEVYPQLQSDVTIFYVEDDIKPFLDMKNQSMYDAYNTYVCKKLPVGPICNPGLDAIKAALYPESSKYNYFITDINGKYYYAITLEEHDRNVAEAEKLGETHGIDTPQA